MKKINYGMVVKVCIGVAMVAYDLVRELELQDQRKRIETLKLGEAEMKGYLNGMHDALAVTVNHQEIPATKTQEEKAE